MYLPTQSMQHEHPGVKCLQEATLLFPEWRQTGKPELATETFTACIQSMTAISKLAKHLLERHGFHCSHRKADVRPFGRTIRMVPSDEWR